MNKVYFCFIVLPLCVCLSYLPLFVPLMLLAVAFFIYIYQHTRILSIIGRTFYSLLFSPLGGLMFFCFAVVLWYLFAGAVVRLTNMPRMSPYSLAPFSAFFNGQAISLVLLIIIPTITMGAFVDEKNSGSYVLLLSFPIPYWEIVFGKLFGLWFYYIFLWLPSLLHLSLIASMGSVDIGQILAIYFLIFSSGLAFISVGLVVSALCSSHLAAFITTMTILLPFNQHIFIPQSGSSSIFSLNYHFSQASRGIIESGPFFFFLGIFVTSIYLLCHIVGSIRWYPIPLTAILKLGYKAMAIAITLVLPFLAIVIMQSNYSRTGWGIIAAGLLFLILFKLVIRKNTIPWNILYGINVFISIFACLVVCAVLCSLAFYYNYYADFSRSKAFKMDRSRTDLSAIHI